MFTPKAFFKHGRPLTIDYTPNGAVNAGDVILTNSRLGIAHADIPANSQGSLSVGDAAYDIQKDSSTFSDRDPWYWDNTAKLATSTSSGNTLGGFCEGGALTGAATVRGVLVLNAGVLTTTVPAIQNAIADPGASGAIPLTTSGNVQLVSAGAETRTIGSPTAVGISLLLICKTHGGDITITVASTINSTGNNTIVFSAAGKAIELVSIITGSTYEWAVRFNDGCTLSTVYIAAHTRHAFMHNVLRKGSNWLLRMQRLHASDWVTYQRGLSSVNVAAVIGKTESEVAHADGLYTKFSQRDYLILVSDLRVNDVLSEPKAGDRIIEGEQEGEQADGATFEVMAEPGLPVWEWADLFRKRYRIHVKYIGQQPLS